MSLWIERWYPTVSGLIAAAIYMTFFRDWRAPDSAKDLLAAGISIGAIAVGFLANMKAVLFSINDREIIKQLKVTGHHGNLVDYLLWAIIYSTFLSIASAVGLVLNFRSHPSFYPLGIATWLWLVAASLASYWRIVSLFGRILKSE